MSRPCTIEYSPSLHVHGNEEINPSGTPYEPSLGTAIDTHSPSGVPCTQSRTWSIAALAAEAADEAPRASMISAPRLPTRGMYSSLTHCSSPTTSHARSPRTLALNRSGYIVGEWLPHTAMCVMSDTAALVRSASCATARLWSSRVI